MELRQEGISAIFKEVVFEDNIKLHGKSKAQDYASNYIDMLRKIN